MKNTASERAKTTPIKMISAQEFAKSNGISVMSVYRMLRRGEIQGAVKLGSQWRVPADAAVPSQYEGENPFDASITANVVPMDMPQRIVLGGVVYVRADTVAMLH